jgi:hypothetical protein
MDSDVHGFGRSGNPEKEVTAVAAFGGCLVAGFFWGWTPRHLDAKIDS